MSAQQATVARALTHRQLGLVPIDAAARDGRCRLVAGPTYYAVARWNGQGWVYPGSGEPLDFEPTDYRP